MLGTRSATFYSSLMIGSCLLLMSLMFDASCPAMSNVEVLPCLVSNLKGVVKFSFRYTPGCKSARSLELFFESNSACLTLMKHHRHHPRLCDSLTILKKINI